MGVPRVLHAWASPLRLLLVMFYLYWGGKREGCSLGGVLEKPESAAKRDLNWEAAVCKWGGGHVLPCGLCFLGEGGVTSPDFCWGSIPGLCWEGAAWGWVEREGQRPLLCQLWGCDLL